MCNLILRLAGLTRTAPIRLRRSLCWKLVRMVGVCPRGAQVRFSGQTNENPLSSAKTRLAPSACHFFLSAARHSVSNGRRLHRRVRTCAVAVVGNSTPSVVTRAKHRSADSARQTTPRSDAPSAPRSSNLRHSRRPKPRAARPAPNSAVEKRTNGWDALAWACLVYAAELGTRVVNVAHCVWSCRSVWQPARRFVRGVKM
jgi:hypothetical protein